MTFKDVAGIALAVLWGGALCWLGMFALLSLMALLSQVMGTRKEGTDRDAAIGVVAIPAFVAVVLYTLSVADLFHILDLLRDRT